MAFADIFLSFIVFSLSSTQAHVLLLPVLSEAEYSENPYECPCNFTNDIYDPICVSNGLTYINTAQFYCEKCKNPDLNLVHKGTCTNEPEVRSSGGMERTLKILNRCPCSLSEEYNPVCGSNGFTYDNLSLLLCDKKCKQPKIELVRYGLCREEEYFKDPLPFLTIAMSRCNCISNDENDPICGTDGYTYPNYLALACVNKCINPSLQIVHYGQCIENQVPHNYGAERCECISSEEEYRPICADNGITYDNFSIFSCARKCLNRDLEILYENPCRQYLDIDDRKIKESKYNIMPRNL